MNLTQAMAAYLYLKDQVHKSTDDDALLRRSWEIICCAVEDNRRGIESEWELHAFEALEAVEDFLEELSDESPAIAKWRAVNLLEIVKSVLAKARNTS